MQYAVQLQCSAATRAHRPPLFLTRVPPCRLCVTDDDGEKTSKRRRHLDSEGLAGGLQPARTPGGAQIVSWRVVRVVCGRNVPREIAPLACVSHVFLRFITRHAIAVAQQWRKS